MKFDKIMIDDEAELWTYICDQNPWYKRKAILILPGGGYEFVDNFVEGDPVAQAFIPYGFNAFVLRYSVNKMKNKFPDQLIQATKAMKHIRDHAEEYGIDSEEVYALGFSAGGHLCGTLATMWMRKELQEAVPMPYGYNKPKGVILMYPVVTGNPEFSHQDSFKNLLCTQNPTKEELASVSLENLVDENTVPAYIVHGGADDAVPVENSLILATAYRKANVPFELHIYPHRRHGFGLGNEITGQADYHIGENISRWVEQAVLWMKTL